MESPTTRLKHWQIYETKLFALGVRAIGSRYLILETFKRSRTYYPLTPIKRSFAKQSTEVSEDVQASAGALTTAQKVKQAGKDVSYIGIMLFGFGVTGALVWYVASELFFSFSPNSVYSKALKIVKKDLKAVDEVGENMKGYGEETSRGRRRHVSYQEYKVGDINYMRVQFYVSGNKGKATVHVEAKEISRGNFEFRYIFLEPQVYPPREAIMILDNR